MMMMAPDFSGGLAEVTVTTSVCLSSTAAEKNKGGGWRTKASLQVKRSSKIAASLYLSQWCASAGR